MVIEGIPYFISPKGMKDYMSKILEMPDKDVRILGLLSMLAGLTIVYIVS